MFYILYEIRNNLNGKIYVGVHKTKSLDDGYMGSGKVIQSAIKKYGIEHFTKTILEQFENAAAMFAREKEIVTDEFLLREDVYNLRRGGFGGFEYINAMPHMAAVRINNARNIPFAAKHQAGKKTGQMNAEKWKADPNSKPVVFTAAFNKEMSIRAMSEPAKAKRKITRQATNFQQGEKNSQFGTCWVWCEQLGNKKIKKESLEEHLLSGWIKKYIPGYKLR